jgi:hypothetical protein
MISQPVTRLAAALASAAAIAIALVYTGGGHGATPANACSIAPSTLEDHVGGESLIAIVEAVSVGAGVNMQPTVTPTATLPPLESSTPTETRVPGLHILPDTATPTSTPTVPSPIGAYPSLDGRGATLRVIEPIHGALPASFAADGTRRADYERYLREREAGSPYVSSCGPLVPPHYTAGGRYIVIIGAERDSSLATFQRWRIEGDSIVLRDPSAGEEQGYLGLREATYRRYFPGVDAQISQYRTDEQGRILNAAYITEPRVRLDAMLATLRALTSGTIITPPDTGSGGDAAATPVVIRDYTGQDDVNTTIAYIVAGDTDALMQRAMAYKAPCIATRSGLEPRPDCPPGVAEGTPLDTTEVAGCEGAYQSDAARVRSFIEKQLARAGQRDVHTVVGSGVTPGFSGSDQSKPPSPLLDAAYSVVITHGPSAPASASGWFLDANGRLLAVLDGCGQAPEQMVRMWFAPDARFLIEAPENPQRFLPDTGAGDGAPSWLPFVVADVAAAMLLTVAGVAVALRRRS